MKQTYFHDLTDSKHEYGIIFKPYITSKFPYGDIQIDKRAY